ncbi:50S ribosomal protein L13 [Candidatus Peregrinibacteria bacterium]|nr:MAG: 50S ribosomal protein L13 [Candidatus Peregrinibacteria bacterium]
MKTRILTTPPKERKWHLIDMNEKVLGRTATHIADLLRGKGKADFTPHIDNGDGVIVINASTIRMTGEKWSQKKYYSHSGYPGGIKEISAENLHEKDPSALLHKAVSGMIPKNKLKKDILKRLRIFPSAEHTMQAQKPEPIAL